ncbi:DUF433 domain-containing protein [Flavobacterium sp.]|jgi:uncharacterized protein (DUF433 family)|uniref:DUF433 domain-containing protein n=1 Tax=Flavobacterium sp. TaxID=239 RepID=UPI0037BFDE62
MEFIEINPKIMLGKPVIKGTRITVEHIISMLAQGISIDEILQEYQGLTKQEILACLQYAENILEKTTTFDLDKVAS